MPNDGIRLLRRGASIDESWSGGVVVEDIALLRWIDGEAARTDATHTTTPHSVVRFPTSRYDKRRTVTGLIVSRRPVVASVPRNALGPIRQ